MKLHTVLGLVGVLLSLATKAQDEPPPRMIAQSEYVRAERLFESGDITRAAQLYSRILEKNSEQPFAWFRLGIIYQQLEKFRPSLQAYDSALLYAEQDPSNAEMREVVAKAHFNRAMLLMDAAAQDLQQIQDDVLNENQEASRVEVHRYMSEALRAAKSRQQLERIQMSRTSERAKGYVYSAERPASAAFAAPLPVVSPDRR
jgi:tetratricopeptide (TPR) repeat protein